MTWFRADEGLAFMLQYENVAWYDAGEVRILDRRIYPAKIEFVRCKTHVEVMQAIRDMVTQSAGPYTAAAMGMALAAYECREKSADEQLAYLQAADETISNARPTTYKRMKLVCDGCLAAAKLALREGRPVDLAIREHAVNANNRRYSKVNEIAKYLGAAHPRRRHGHDAVLRRDDRRHDAEGSEAVRKDLPPVLPGNTAVLSGRTPDSHGLP